MPMKSSPLFIHTVMFRASKAITPSQAFTVAPQHSRARKNCSPKHILPAIKNEQLHADHVKTTMVTTTTIVVLVFLVMALGVSFNPRAAKYTRPHAPSLSSPSKFSKPQAPTPSQSEFPSPTANKWSDRIAGCQTFCLDLPRLAQISYQ